MNCFESNFREQFIYKHVNKKFYQSRIITRVVEWSSFSSKDVFMMPIASG